MSEPTPEETKQATIIGQDEMLKENQEKNVNRLDTLAKTVMDGLEKMKASPEEALFLFSHLSSCLLGPYAKVHKIKFLQMFDDHYHHQKGKLHRARIGAA